MTLYSIFIYHSIGLANCVLLYLLFFFGHFKRPRSFDIIHPLLGRGILRSCCREIEGRTERQQRRASNNNKHKKERGCYQSNPEKRVEDVGEVCGLAKNGRQTTNLGSKVCTFFWPTNVVS
jgi:hypothetical protein